MNGISFSPTYDSSLINDTWTDCSKKAEELEQQGWNWICCRGGDFGTSEAQKPFELAWILFWRSRTLDSLWLYAKPEHTFSTSWTACSRMQSGLGKKNEDCHRFCRRDRVSLATSVYHVHQTAVTLTFKIVSSCSYLHHYATPHIIHRDVKASNVLLDSNFQARVADFGFAKLIPDGATHVTTKVKGTLGYLAPEYAMLGKANESCDVFSFGIMLLELASGKRPVEKLNPTTKRTIAEWALPLARDKKFMEIADPKFNGNFVEDELKRMVLVGLACSQNKPEQRPIMTEVVELLKGESAEKLLNLENDEMFKPEQTNSFQGSSGPNSSDCITEEKSSKADAIEAAVDSSETIPSAR